MFDTGLSVKDEGAEALMKKAEEWIEAYDMIGKGERIIVGVSGGADSVCLLFVLKKYQKKRPFFLEAVHVEHGIRGEESLKDAAFVEKLCESLEVPFHLERVDVKALAKKEGLSEEEAGRVARYRAFEKWRKQTGAKGVAVAHNANDQAETILWNLIRGSGLRGMGGMQPVNGCIIRPLLGCKREEIEQWLFEQGISYRTDRTNLEQTYTRNRIRLRVLPYLEQELNAGAVEHIVMAGERLRKAEACLERRTLELAKEIGRVLEGEAWLDREALVREEEILQEYLIRWAVRSCGSGLKDITAGHIRDLRKLAASRSGSRLDLPGELWGLCSGRWLKLICKEEGEPLQPLPVPVALPGRTCWGDFYLDARVEAYRGENIPEKKYTKWLDYDTIKDTIWLRGRKSGDFFVTNSGGGHKKLKKYFIDQKIPVEERDHIPLLAAGSHILWCVGGRISEGCKVTKDTDRVLVVEIREVKNGR